MATNPSLKLDDSPRTKVFRRLEQIFRTDPTLDRVIAKQHWRTYAGDAADKQPFGINACPSVVMGRIPGPEGFWSPDAMTGDMLVQLILQVRGTCEDDADNLYWAFQRAIYPRDPSNPRDRSKQNAIVQSLQAAGAHTGLVTFSQPAFDPRTLDGQASEGMIIARGEMKITVRNSF